MNSKKRSQNALTTLKSIDVSRLGVNMQGFELSCPSGQEGLEEFDNLVNGFQMALAKGTNKSPFAKALLTEPFFKGPAPSTDSRLMASVKRVAVHLTAV